MKQMGHSCENALSGASLPGNLGAILRSTTSRLATLTSHGQLAYSLCLPPEKSARVPSLPRRQLKRGSIHHAAHPVGCEKRSSSREEADGRLEDGELPMLPSPPTPCWSLAF